VGRGRRCIGDGGRAGVVRAMVCGGLALTVTAALYVELGFGSGLWRDLSSTVIEEVGEGGDEGAAAGGWCAMIGAEISGGTVESEERPQGAEARRSRWRPT
jgi:hypothetical protein